jgi:hypothetical protein
MYLFLLFFHSPPPPFFLNFFPPPSSLFLSSPLFFFLFLLPLPPPLFFPSSFSSLCRDGFAAKDFHKLCDMKGPTLTVIEATDDFIFGGYTSETWDGNCVHKSDPTAFIFTLSNPHSIPPTHYPILPSLYHQAIQCNPSFGALFGATDLHVYPAPNTLKISCTNFPNSYEDTTGKGPKTFTGALNFSTKDVEVYLVT